MRESAVRRASDLAEADGLDVATRSRVRPNAPVLALLALGHLVIDTNQGALPALLPFLRPKFGLSYAAAGTILLVANLTSSVIQPVFGHLSDRTTRRFLLRGTPPVLRPKAPSTGTLARGAPPRYHP